MKITESQLRLIVRDEIMRSGKRRGTLSESAAPDFSKYGLSPEQGDYLWLAFYYMIEGGHAQRHDLGNPTALFNKTLNLYRELLQYGELSEHQEEVLRLLTRLKSTVDVDSLVRDVYLNRPHGHHEWSQPSLWTS